MEKLLLVLPYFSHAIKILRLMFLLLISEDLCAQSTGTLIVSPKPKEAEIQLFRDTTLVAEWMGKKRFKELPVGSYTIKANYFGFLPYEETVNVLPDKKVKRKIRLAIPDVEKLSEKYPSDSEVSDKAFKKGDRHPEIVGGMSVLYKLVKYPEDARKVGAEGTVLVRVIVGADGKAKDIEIIQGIHRACDLEARRAVSKLRFKPALVGGKIVETPMVIPVVFRLSN